MSTFMSLVSGGEGGVKPAGGWWKHPGGHGGDGDEDSVTE